MNGTTTRDPWMTTDEAAEYLRLHRDTITAAIRRGELRGVKVGQTYRLRESWCDAYLMGGAA